MSDATETHSDRSIDAPAVRARFLQLWLTFPERYDARAAESLARIVGDEKRRAILDAPLLAWLPIELDVQIVDAVARVLGPRRFGELTRAYFEDIMPRQPLRVLLDLGTKMIGRSPQSFVRWWNRGWSAVYRNCGHVRGIVESESQGRVIYDRLPRVCVESEPFLDALLSTSYGVYSLTGYTGVVRVAGLRREDGYLELEFEWQAKRSVVT